MGVEYAKERLPLRLPLDCGANVVVSLTLWPGARVNGMPRPVVLNPVPETVVWEIVRFELPVLLRTADCDTLLPI